MIKSAYTVEELYQVARVYCTRTILNKFDREDAVQEFVIAAVEAEKRDNGMGIRSLQRIRGRGAVIDWLRKRTPGIRYDKPLIQVSTNAVTMTTGMADTDDEDMGAVIYALNYKSETALSMTTEEELTLEKGMNELPIQIREVLSLYYNGSTLREIGERMGFTESYAQQLKHKGLQRLRESFALIKRDKSTKMTSAIIDILKKEMEPLKIAEIYDRLESVGYPVKGINKRKVCCRVSASVSILKRKGKVKNMGKQVGWTLTERKAA